LARKYACRKYACRKYAYQVLLVDELHRAGVEVVLLNRALGQTPEDDLLLQVQGMVAEYERAKILERSRRGKRFAARNGTVSVLCGAPYGYRYVSKLEGADQARYELCLEEARVVRQVFAWVGRERVSVGEVCRRLSRAGIRTRSGKTTWDRTTIWGMLKNPVYRGAAAFGKTRAAAFQPRVRAQRGRALTPRRAVTTVDVSQEEWITVPVPALVSAELFAAVQEQLGENRRHARQSQRGARYLLQGLLCCASCGYAFYGKAISPSAAKHHPTAYAYYRCIGADAYRFGGQRLCHNPQVRTDLLDDAVWQEVRQLLEDPQRLLAEYERRRQQTASTPHQADVASLETQLTKLRQGMGRLIDSYAEGLIEKRDFEPRITRFKERVSALEAQAQDRRAEAELQQDLQLLIGHLDDFAVAVKSRLDQVDWHTQRALIRALVKRVEIAEGAVTVVFRIGPGPITPDRTLSLLPDCGRSQWRTLRGTSSASPASSASARPRSMRQPWLSSLVRSSAAWSWLSPSAPSWRPWGSWSPRSQRHVVIIASTRSARGFGSASPSIPGRRRCALLGGLQFFQDRKRAPRLPSVVLVISSDRRSVRVVLSGGDRAA
jgi:site-specific DNA recombinase